MKTKSNKILKVAHRGASATCPENTLLAFNTAWENGADIVEGDFRLTKDQKIVCIHDEDTYRVSGERKTISDTSYDELLRVNVGYYFDEKLVERIPTLQQVLSTVPKDGRFLIEIKSGIEIVPILIKDLSISNIDRLQFGVISFDKEVLRMVNAADKDIITLLLNEKNNEMSNKDIKDTLIDIGANGLLTNSGNAELKDEIESLKMIYNVYMGASEFEVRG